MKRRNLPAALLGIFLWSLLFFPDWYALSSTKVRELSALNFASREEQLAVLHPTEDMRSLLRLKQRLQEKYPNGKVSILGRTQRDELHPLATDASIQRAVFYPVPIISSKQLLDTEVLVILVNSQEEETCLERIPDGFSGEVVCWHL